MKKKFTCHFCMKVFYDKKTPRIEFQKGFKVEQSCGSCWDKNRGEYFQIRTLTPEELSEELTSKFYEAMRK